MNFIGEKKRTLQILQKKKKNRKKAYELHWEQHNPDAAVVCFCSSFLRPRKHNRQPRPQN